MKLDGGYLIMDEFDIKLLSGLEPMRIEERYEVNQFIAEMVDWKESLTRYLGKRTATNDQTMHEELQVEVVELYIQMCETCIDRARKAIRDAGANILFH